MTKLKVFGLAGLRRAGRVVRDAWLICGIALLLILALEAGFRTARAIKEARESSTTGPPNPFMALPWAADYLAGHDKEGEVRWAPYVYLRNPTFQTTHLTVDVDGHRVTPTPPGRPAASRTVRIFFMGGSTTFGWFQRDAHTIPAEAARRVQSLLGDAARVEVTNFGVPGHTFTQEVLELILQLRAGARPDVVVFYDGINDVMATVQNGKAGNPQNEANRENDFERGRLLTGRRGFAADAGVIRHMAEAALSRLHLVRYFTGGARSQFDTSTPPASALSRSIVEVFAANARIVEALAADYKFRPIYVWQPALLSSRKPLTPREGWLLRLGDAPDNAKIRDVHRAVPATIAAAMTPVAGSRFIDATALFDDDPQEVFLDLFGHTYERANPVIVDHLMPVLAAALSD